MAAPVRVIRPLASPDLSWRQPVISTPWVAGQLSSTIQPPGAIPRARKARMSGWAQPANLSTISDIARIQAAIRAAERGQTQQLFTLYRDYIAGGGHLGAELAKRKMALCAEPLSITPSRKGNNADQKAADVVRKTIDLCPTWERDLLHLLDSCFYPVSVSEKIFEPADYSGEVKLQWRLKQLAQVDPILLCFFIPYVSTGSNQRPAMTAPVSPATSIPVGPNPDAAYDQDDWEPNLRFWNNLPNGYIDWAFADVYRPDPARHLIHRGNFMCLPDNFGGPGRGCLFWTFYAIQGRDWFAKAVEFFGQPIPTVKADLENVDVLNDLQQMFNEARKLRAFFVNLGSEIEFQEARTEQMAAAYQTYIHMCHDEISKSLVGQSLSSHAISTGMGSGQSKMATDVRDDIRRFDHLMMGQTLKRCLFQQIMDLNGVDKSAEPPNAYWGGAKEDDVKLLSQSLAQLSQAQVEPTDDALDELSRRLGFRIQRLSPEKIAMMGPKGPMATVDGPPPKKKTNGEPIGKGKD